ncbi:hypothetical protein, partial [Bacteroides timonensis]|uniref:hypothetical protein n=1 Tax=Bacteroides timonensis TaxID=1470345 RepID=UPI001AE050E4
MKTRMRSLNRLKFRGLYIRLRVHKGFIEKRVVLMRALKKFPTCNKSLPNTQKIDCESFFLGFPIYFCFSAFVAPMPPSIFFFDGCLAKNGFS